MEAAVPMGEVNIITNQIVALWVGVLSEGLLSMNSQQNIIAFYSYYSFVIKVIEEKYLLKMFSN
jgi:hypothetical protein